MVVDRNLFIRAASIAQGRLKTASKKRVFATSNFKSYLNAPPEQFALYKLALRILGWIHEGGKGSYRATRLREDAVYKTRVALIWLQAKTKDLEPSDELIQSSVEETRRYWDGFFTFQCRKYKDDAKYWRTSKQNKQVFDFRRSLEHVHAAADISEFFGDPKKHMAEADLDSPTQEILG